MMRTLSGAEQRPLARCPVDRRENIAEMASGATRCFVPDAWQNRRLNLCSVHDSFG